MVTGKIAVHYDVTFGNVSSLSAERQRATPDSDFMSGGGTMEMADKQSSAIIEIGIFGDDIPEVDEVFVVKLTAVDLLDQTDTGFRPTIGEVINDWS